jgi:hypothetical protein
MLLWAQASTGRDKRGDMMKSSWIGFGERTSANAGARRRYCHGRFNGRNLVTAANFWLPE